MLFVTANIAASINVIAVYSSDTADTLKNKAYLIARSNHYHNQQTAHEHQDFYIYYPKKPLNISNMGRIVLCFFLMIGVVVLC